MKQAVVLGIGNRLMSDDGIGVRIVEGLARGSRSEQVRYAVGETDIEYCLDQLNDADDCIIVDAACLGNEPCTVHVLDLAAVLKQKSSFRSFHEFDLLQGMKIYNMMKEGILITIEVCSLSFSSELSPLMEKRFDEIQCEVEAIITEHFGAL